MELESKADCRPATALALDLYFRLEEQIETLAIDLKLSILASRRRPGALAIW